MITKQVHTGDAGNTETLSGKSVPKNVLRIETLGEMDEVQSILGIIRSLIKQKDTKELLVQIQDDLRLIMGEIASEKVDPLNAHLFDDTYLTKLEDKIQIYQKQDELPKGFITPGDDFTSAMIDLGRTITRRAERRAVSAYRARIIRNPSILKYINRLSTFLYFMEIHEMKQAKNQRLKHGYTV
jgi:cob(I)alamin adenosyltransferase